MIEMLWHVLAPAGAFVAGFIIAWRWEIHIVGVRYGKRVSLNWRQSLARD